MLRLNASDDRWRCIDTATNPMQIGGLLLFETGPDMPADQFAGAVARHLERRLPDTPLSVRFQAAPWHVDTGVWLRVGSVDVGRHLEVVSGETTLDRASVNALVAERVMRGWDQGPPPFRLVVLDRLSDDVAGAPGTVGLLLQTHHSLVDGIGFQAIVEDLTDGTPEAGTSSDAAAPAAHDERAPLAPLWLAGSAVRFAAAGVEHVRARSDRQRATAELGALRARPDARRARTPEVPGLSLDSTTQRRYERVTLSLPEAKAVANTLGGTVNDVFLTVVGGALRRLLAERGVLDEVGDHPLVALVPRSVREAHHGRYGNHLTMMLPQLGTHLADPVERFAAVRSSVRAERERNDLQRRLAPLEVRPFAARRRRATPEVGTSAGNVSLSNVPGPSTPRYLAGYRMLANFPAPNLVAGQFLNITLRRYLDHLHLGVMTDPCMIDDLAPLCQYVHDAVDELRTAASQA